MWPPLTGPKMGSFATTTTATKKERRKGRMVLLALPPCTYDSNLDDIFPVQRRLVPWKVLLIRLVWSFDDSSLVARKRFWMSCGPGFGFNAGTCLMMGITGHSLYLQFLCFYGCEWVCSVDARAFSEIIKYFSKITHTNLGMNERRARDLSFGLLKIEVE